MFQTFAQNYRRFGLTNSVYDCFYRSLNAVITFHSLTGMIATDEKLAVIDLPEDCDFTIRFLGQDELRHHAKDPANDLSEDFLPTAFAKGDHCLAILDGETLASYGWYASKPARIQDGMDLFFDPDWMYMYKGLTKPDYRGLRLHAVGMSHATRHFSKAGSKGLISYVESNNFASMKSCTRMGYEIFGSIYILSAFGRFVTFSTAGCRPYAFFAGKTVTLPKAIASPDHAADAKPAA